MMLLLAIANICLVFMLPMMAWIGRSGAPGVNQFVVACALCVAAFSFTLIGGEIWTMAFKVAADSLIIAACLCIHSGFRHILEQRALTPGKLLVIFAFVLVFLCLATVLPEAETLVALTAGCTVTGILLVTSLDIARYGPRRSGLEPHLLFCGLACFTAALLQIPGLAALAMTSDGLVRMTLTTARTLSIPLLFLSILLLQQGWVISQLHRRIARDDLTNVLSRRAFMDHYARLSKSDPASGKTNALLLLDLDHFKRINDRYGHAGGDAALRHFAIVIRRTLPDEAIFGRLGGEEFGIILPRTAASDACTMADGLCDLVRLSPAMSPFSEMIRMTVSIGVATDDDREGAGDLMHRADMALYAAKSAGRDRSAIAPSGDMPFPNVDDLVLKAMTMRNALYDSVHQQPSSMGQR